MSIWHTASDDAGRVQVSVEQNGRDVRVAVLPGWRRSGGEPSLGRAVLAAVCAAEAVRRVARVGDPSTLLPDGSGPLVSPSSWTTPFALLHRASRDLDEYRMQLRQLRDRASTVTDPGQVVTVRLLGAQMVAVEIDASWLSSAGDTEVAQRLTAALTAATRAARAQLDRAMAGSPDLIAVLTGAPSALRGPGEPQRVAQWGAPGVPQWGGHR